MKIPTLALILVLLGMSPLASAEESAHEKILLGNSVTEMLKWFSSLSNEFDKFVEVEKKKQFLRKLNKLNIDLYKLKRRKVEFVEIINYEYKYLKIDSDSHNLDIAFEELISRYRKVKTRLHDIGADLSKNGRKEGEKVRIIIEESVAERTKGLYRISEELRRGTFNLEEINEYSKKGISALELAHTELSVLIRALENR